MFVSIFAHYNFMTKKLFLLLSMACLAIAANAKDGYHVKGTILNNTDSLVYACYYYGNGTTVQKLDSAKLTKGTATFDMKGSKKLVGGIFMLLFADKSPQVEFILENGKDVELTFDKGKMPESITFVNDESNTNFYADKMYLIAVNKRVEMLTEKLKSGKKKDTTAVNAEYEVINKEIFDNRDKLIAKNPTSIMGVLFKGMKEPDTKKKPVGITDEKKIQEFQYRYYKNNYWSDWDFNDDRLIYAPVYDDKLTKYFKQLIPSIPDSFNVEADKLMKRVKCGTDMYKYTFWWLAHYAGVSKVMGMDESYVYMIEQYVMNRDYCGHLDTATKRAYIEDAIRIAPNTIGKKGKDIVLPSNMEVSQSLHDLCKKGEITVLAFFDPTCHHCEVEVPAVDSALNAIEKELGIVVNRYVVQNADEDDKWRKFIKDKRLNNHYTHVHNPSRVGSYRVDYNIVSNPVFYLLDKNGIIKGKRLDHTNIGGLIKHLLKPEPIKTE